MGNALNHLNVVIESIAKEELARCAAYRSQFNLFATEPGSCSQFPFASNTEIELAMPVF